MSVEEQENRLYNAICDLVEQAELGDIVFLAFLAPLSLGVLIMCASFAFFMIKMVCV